MKNFLKQVKKTNGEMGFGTQILIFILALFILWILTNGPEKTPQNQSLFVPYYNN